ncbi:unnamed protein product [Oppiella nova]|uniref:Uncharacterized protein n=1 Tax=Oppiella nova TaxID=334625 RepID=A0A7R9QBP4_9ACAR|nr:unnamed protein product [Oppiella nova]CAG2162500.1 unnamed protein product [Oppiella nova]
MSEPSLDLMSGHVSESASMCVTGGGESGVAGGAPVGMVGVVGGTVGWVDPVSEQLSSGDHQNAANSSQFADHYAYNHDYNSQTNTETIYSQSVAHGVNVEASDNQYYQYYANYYQHFQHKNELPVSETDFSQSASTGAENSRPRPIDLINKALARQRSDDNKGSTDGNRDDDEEEGQIPSSPRHLAKRATNGSHTPPTPVTNSGRNSRNYSSKSRSRSPPKDGALRSRSRSRSRKRYVSRSRSRSRRRRRSRSRSRSRSPYFGPIIKDYRRGRRGFVRYPRGFRDRSVRSYGRGNHSQYGYGGSRRHESRSQSRSVSPKRRHVESDKRDETNNEEKADDSKNSETLKPSDIKSNEKRLTQSFLAMLEEKQSKSKMIPFDTNNEAIDDDNRQHGFVNTFNSIREMEAKKHTLSYDLEREGWQVIDDANSESSRKRRNTKDVHKSEDKSKHLVSKESVGHEKTGKEVKDESSSSGNETSHKKRKSKKRRNKKKRSSSTSSDSSDSESDHENEDEVEVSDKKSKKKRKSRKKKKKVVSSSSSSEDESTQKKKSKTKRADTSSDSETEDKPKENSCLTPTQKLYETNTLAEKVVSVEKDETDTKAKDKKKKKRKQKDYDSSDSDVEKEKKKKKKKRRKKSSKRRKRRSSSSSSSSDSSDTSESEDRKKKRRKHKKKKSRKHKKDKKLSENKEKTKVMTEDKKKMKDTEIEFVTVLSVGETPVELKWPKNLIKYTQCEPSIQYSISPKVTVNSDDFKQTKEPRNKIVEEIERIRHFGIDNESENKGHEKLTTEYEKFMDEVNPNYESHAISEESKDLETKLREKLVKQLYDKKDDDFEAMTPAERRAIEKKKKSYHSYVDASDDHRRHEDLKSAPMSAYYSAKVQKSSPPPVHRSSETEKYETKSSKTNETESYHKMNEISLNISEQRSHSSHSSDKHSSQKSSEDKKKTTAKELLERVKQRKDSNKDSKETTDKDDSHRSKRLPQTAKIPPNKKWLTRSKTVTANADSTQNTFVSQPMKLDMNFDYNWYYNYYMSSMYALGQYPQAPDPTLSSAYYAQYSMATSNDYNPTDLTNWMTQKGYTLDSTNSWIPNQSAENVTENSSKSQESQSCVESSALELNPTLTSDRNDSNEQMVDKIVTNEENNDMKDKTTEADGQQNIGVLISSTQSDMPFDSELGLDSESKDQTDSSDMSPFSLTQSKQKVKVRVNATSHNDMDVSDGDSPPPPPPPQPRPLMTTMTSSDEYTLPNGQVLPAGTKQIVVHPYQTDDPNKFTAEWYYNAYDGQQTPTNSS